MGNLCSVATRSEGTLRLGAKRDFPNATFNENWKTAHDLGINLDKYVVIYFYKYGLNFRCISTGFIGVFLIQIMRVMCLFIKINFEMYINKYGSHKFQKPREFCGQSK